MMATFQWYWKWENWFLRQGTSFFKNYYYSLQKNHRFFRKKTQEDGTFLEIHKRLFDFNWLTLVKVMEIFDSQFLTRQNFSSEFQLLFQAENFDSKIFQLGISAHFPSWKFRLKKFQLGISAQKFRVKNFSLKKELKFRAENFDSEWNFDSQMNRPWVSFTYQAIRNKP